MTRSIAAVVVGYLVFGVSSALLFGVSGRDPHDMPTTGFMAWSVVYGCAFAALGGYLAARIAPARGLVHAALVAALIAAIAIASLVVEWRAGSIWSELVVLTLIAPSAVAGGYVRMR